MRVYADSSFLVALYLRNEHTDEAFRLWRSVFEPPLPFNPMHRLEVRNAIRRMVFTRETERATARRALQALDRDIGEDLQHQALDWTAVLRRAEQIGGAHTESRGLRA